MSRRFTPKIVTANRLREGDVVYLTADDRWSPFHHEAELIEDEAHAQMRRRRNCWSWVPIWPMQSLARTAPNPPISAKSSAPAAPRTTTMANRPITPDGGGGVKPRPTHVAQSVGRGSPRQYQKNP